MNKTAQSQFRNRKLAICPKQYPEIGRLPVPIQKLLAVELNAAEERIGKGKEVPTDYVTVFYLEYYLLT